MRTESSRGLPEDPLADLMGHRLVFVGGLHRSGTTAMARCIAGHPQVSGFAATGAKEDEGQHLQSVYPPARTHGGPGRFARAAAAHLTEESPLVTPDNARLLFEQWRPHWDLSRPVLLEKSPPNLVMTRFLQALYPDAYFLMVVRHPVVVSLSTKKWVGESLERLLETWFHAHEVFVADAARLRRVHVVKYEDFVGDSEQALRGVADFLGLDGPIPTETIDRHRSRTYADQWERLVRSRWPWQRAAAGRLIDRFEEQANRYGYSLRDLDRCAPFALPAGN